MLSKSDQSVRLSMKEFETMRILISYEGNIVTKDYLIRKVWGADSEAEDNNVEVYISFFEEEIVLSDFKSLDHHGA